MKRYTLKRAPKGHLYETVDIEDGELKDGRGKALRVGGRIYVPRTRNSYGEKPSVGGTVKRIYRNQEGRAMVSIIEPKTGQTRTVLPENIRVQRVFPKRST